MDDKEKIKEQRRQLYNTNKEEYKNVREQFKRSVSKTFRDINQNVKKELEALDTETMLANEMPEEGQKMNKLIIREVHKEEFFTIENVIREAFWNIYKPGCDEHLMEHQLRKSDDYVHELDLIASKDGVIAGNVMCSHGLVKNDDTLKEDRNNILFLGPIGVLPQFQKTGIGSQLMQKVIEKARQLKFKGIVLYGNPNYYHRFGFVNAEQYGLRTYQNTNLESFMALELTEGSLNGIHGRCYESGAFHVEQNVLTEFEKQFPKKERTGDENYHYLDYTTFL